jgi:hypothetical protein
MITSERSRDRGASKRDELGKVVKIATIPKRLHGMHAGDKSVWDWQSEE